MNCSITRPNRLNRSLTGDLDKVFNDLRTVLEPSFVFGLPRGGASRAGGASSGTSVPPINVWEDEQNVYVESEVPGLAMSELDISLTAGELSIRGRREPHAEQEGVTYHRRERTSGEFQRTLRIGVPIDHEKVGASLTQGVLLVTLPKAEAAKPRKIEVKGG